MFRKSVVVVVAVGSLGAAAFGYANDRDAPFFLGLLGLAATLAVASLAAARRGSRWALLTNTVVFALLGLALLEPFLRARERERSRQPVEPVYTYSAARADPRAFARWWERYLAEWNRTQGLYLMSDPRGVNPMVPIPGRRFRFFDSPHAINALGFRGPEIRREKGDAYRVIALGESTTFGATVTAEDRPWPRRLEEIVAEELDCEVPVQVVNAGVPGWTLANNLARLEADIWPLDPDLLISYHGYNGFSYLLQEIPEIRVGHAPAVPPERPSRLLAGVEHRLRLWWFSRRYAEARRVDERVLDIDLQATRYAALYRQLVDEARKAGVELVLATFNLAVDGQSPEEVIRFYEVMFPDLRARILANRLHTRLLGEIGRATGVTVIDTSPGLDGAYETAFIDPMHFTQTGRERLARTLFEGIRPRLEADVPCTPRGARPGDAG